MTGGRAALCSRQDVPVRICSPIIQGNRARIYCASDTRRVFLQGPRKRAAIVPRCQDSGGFEQKFVLSVPRAQNRTIKWQRWDPCLDSTRTNRIEARSSEEHGRAIVD